MSLLNRREPDQRDAARLEGELAEARRQSTQQRRQSLVSTAQPTVDSDAKAERAAYQREWLRRKRAAAKASA